MRLGRHDLDRVCLLAEVVSGQIEVVGCATGSRALPLERLQTDFQVRCLALGEAADDHQRAVGAQTRLSVDW